MALRHWLILSLTDGVGPIIGRRMIDAAGSVERACELSLNELKTVEGVGTSKASKIHEALKRAADSAIDEIHRASSAGARIICPDDAEYPPLLHTIPDPPFALYVRGAVEPRDLNAVAIVGSRKCSFYGREQAERFGALLAGAGVTVTSGGARGIDSSAHRGALQVVQGRTIAVLGSGVDVPYPPENKSLLDQIAERGAVISEYPMGTPPLAENFPRRNRIVSGMSRGVFVIEADERSGALITARQAGEDQGRPVFALPGRVDNRTSIGPHKLIRDGATLVTALEDILDGLGPLPAQVGEPSLFEPGAAAEAVIQDIAALATVKAAPVPTITLTERQQRIVAALSADGIDVDRIIERTGLEASPVLQELTILSLKGVVRRLGGQTFALRS